MRATPFKSQPSGSPIKRSTYTFVSVFISVTGMRMKGTNFVKPRILLEVVNQGQGLFSMVNVPRAVSNRWPTASFLAM